MTTRNFDNALVTEGSNLGHRSLQSLVNCIPGAQDTTIIGDYYFVNGISEELAKQGGSPATRAFMSIWRESGHTDAGIQVFLGQIFERVHGIKIIECNPSEIDPSAVIRILCERFCFQLAGSFPEINVEVRVTNPDGTSLEFRNE